MDIPVTISHANLPAIVQSASSGTVVGQVLALDEDLGNNGVITYSSMQLSPISSSPSFTVNSVTGSLVVSQAIDADIDYQVLITATVNFS